MELFNIKDDRLLTRFDLKDLGISYVNVTLLRQERAGKFPRRIYLSSHRVGWWESEVLSYLETKSQERV